MTDTVTPLAVGTPLRRLDGPAKVTGAAPYAYEHPFEDPVFVHPLQATIARGRVRSVDTAAARELPGVLAVLTPGNAPRLADTGDGELAVLQSDEVAFRGQFVGAVLAETPETARHAAGLVRVDYAREPHDAELTWDHPRAYAPESVNGGFETDTGTGDVDLAMATAAVTVDQRYSTPTQHNNPMEPHTCVARWERVDGRETLTLHDSTQGAHNVRRVIAGVFGLDPEQVRVVSPHVGGGFGAKGLPHAHNVLAVLAARLVEGRPAKLALTRQQLFALAGYRPPTRQRVRLAADAAGHLLAVSHESLGLSSRVKEFAEQTATAARMMYAGANRRTRHRVVPLDVPVPSWMRAPGECPGMFALELAMDELALACGLDPVELRVRNDPAADPETGRPWSGRKLVECLRTGAERFGWAERTGPGTRREGDWLVGLGVASATYPVFGGAGSSAEVERLRDGYAVRVGAADLGTGTRTALTQIAADALGCPVDAVRTEIGDTALPRATVAGGSSGITSWSAAIVAAVSAFRAEHGPDPAPGATTRADAPENPAAERFALHSFGAQFAEARVHRRTGEVRVPRMLGVFSVGRVVNPLTARSQLLGGMVMGLSAALHEESVLDPATGHVINHDLAAYSVPTCADVGDLEALWLAEEDPNASVLGTRGIGEIGIVGSPAAVVNAVHDATGIRVRDLPVTPDKLLV